MRKKLYTILLVCITLSGSSRIQAQYLQFLPEWNNYINGDVTADASGTTYNILFQDTALKLYRVLLRTSESGVLQSAMLTQNYYRHAVTSDGAMISIGGARLADGSSAALIQKNDASGNHVWTRRIKTSSNSGIGNVIVNDSDVIYVTVSNSLFISSTYYTRNSVLAFDTAGNRLWTRYYGNAANTTDYKFSRTIVASNGDFIGVADIRGSAGNSANGMMVTRISQQGTVIFSRYFDFISTHNQLSVTGLAETPGGDVIFGGRLMTDQISTTTNKMWMGKVDARGNTLIQKTYDGGENVGEQLHSLQFHNGILYAYLHIHAPFDTPARGFWVGTVDTQTLAVHAHTSIDANLTLEDPYGDVADAFCITASGKPTFAGGIYCTERGRYLSVLGQFDEALNTSCNALAYSSPLTDSVAAYTDQAYTPAGSFTITVNEDTSRISLIPFALPQPGDLCQGCVHIPTTAVSKTAEALPPAIYPNPGDGLFHIDYTPASADAYVSVYSSTGAIVYNGKLPSGRSSLSLVSHAPGVYHLRIHDGSTVKTAKLVKQ